MSEVKYAIAEAFRELEQRAEAAEALAAEIAIKCAAYAEANVKNLDRAEAAEAKLAELEKQEPYGYVVITGTGAKKFSTRHPRPRVTNEPPVAVFTRPAPAADLAGLVPERKSVPESGSTFDSVTHWCDGFNSCRAAILRKIEEAK